MRRTKRNKVRKTKLRKNMRYFYLGISLLVFVFSCCKIVALFSNNKIKNKQTEIYSYTNKFDYTYNVNLISNKYIDEKSLSGKSAYVTDLIDNIDMNMNYLCTGSKSSNIDCTYEVTGILGAVYTKDGEEQKILEKEYQLINEKKDTFKNGKTEINENIKLNLKEQNNLIKDFEQKMNMTVSATYTIEFKTKTKTNIEGEDVENTYQSQIIIGLGDKTTKIYGDNNKEETEYVNSTIKENVNTSPIELIIFSTLIIISMLVFKYILDRTENINRIKNEYRQEVNRILKLCREKIVQVRSKPEINDKNLIDVRDFGEIIKLSEELFKPILYWEDKEKEESSFIIMSNNIVYRYTLRK